MTICKNDLEDGRVFDAAQELYWYCSNHHTGQSSTLYEVLCKLDYKPGPLERKPDGREFYDQLVNHEIDPENLLEMIEEFLNDSEY